MLYNILSYKDPNEGMLMAVNIAPQGLSDFLFNNGVRILAPALTRDEVRGFIVSHNISFDHVEYNEMVERVTNNTNHDQEPSRAWKGRYSNPWDNKLNPKYPTT